MSSSVKQFFLYSVWMGIRARISRRQWAQAALIGLLSTAPVFLMGARPVDPSTAAGVFPPWWSAARIVDAAGRAGEIRGLGALPFVVIVSGPDAAASLRRAGAFVVVGSDGLVGCGSGRA
jgi:hypothetical protein